MSKKRVISNKNFYHLYNKGVEQKKVFLDDEDLKYFQKLLKFFNTKKALGRLGRYKKIDDLYLKEESKKPLVDIIAYCINSDHYHLILYQLTEKGVSKFMQKIVTAYTMYFNKKYNHAGPIFSGRFKSKLIENLEELEYLSVYVNLNYVVHKPALESFKLHTPPKDKQKYLSSWNEYIGKAEKNICQHSYLTKNFKSREQYRNFSKYKLTEILEFKKRELEK